MTPRLPSYGASDDFSVESTANTFNGVFETVWMSKAVKSHNQKLVDVDCLGPDEVDWHICSHIFETHRGLQSELAHQLLNGLKC